MKSTSIVRLFGLGLTLAGTLSAWSALAAVESTPPLAAEFRKPGHVLSTTTEPFRTCLKRTGDHRRCNPLVPEKFYRDQGSLVSVAMAPAQQETKIPNRNLLVQVRDAAGELKKFTIQLDSRTDAEQLRKLLLHESTTLQLPEGENRLRADADFPNGHPIHVSRLTLVDDHHPTPVSVEKILHPENAGSTWGYDVKSLGRGVKKLLGARSPAGAHDVAVQTDGITKALPAAASSSTPSMSDPAPAVHTAGEAS